MVCENTSDKRGSIRILSSSEVITIISLVFPIDSGKCVQEPIRNTINIDSINPDISPNKMIDIFELSWKASILVNGVSLTISKVSENIFQSWVIPHSLKLTNLSNLKKNDAVNIEVDILSKYVKRYFNEK